MFVFFPKAAFLKIPELHFLATSLSFFFFFNFTLPSYDLPRAGSAFLQCTLRSKQPELPSSTVILSTRKLYFDVKSMFNREKIVGFLATINYVYAFSFRVFSHFHFVIQSVALVLQCERRPMINRKTYTLIVRSWSDNKKANEELSLRERVTDNKVLSLNLKLEKCNSIRNTQCKSLKNFILKIYLRDILSLLNVFWMSFRCFFFLKFTLPRKSLFFG